jgi:hypothetical protein
VCLKLFLSIVYNYIVKSTKELYINIGGGGGRLLLARSFENICLLYFSYFSVSISIVKRVNLVRYLLNNSTNNL